VPGVFTEGFQFYAPEEIDNEYTLGEGKLMVNVGSVGQPRDGDNRACYVVLDDGLPDVEPASAPPAAEGGDDADVGVSQAETLMAVPPLGPVRITYRRLPYDFERTIQKIYAVPELEPFLGDRLRQGR
jgi:hypothetical protein